MLLIAALAAFAAPLGARPRASPVAQEAPGAPAAPHFASPREVLEAFVSVYEFERTGESAALDRAAATLDVGGLAGRERARRLVQRLGRVFDHVAVVDPAAIQADLDRQDAERAARGEPVDPSRKVWTVSPPGRPELSIAIVLARGARGWLIAPETVEKIDAWYVAVEDLALIDVAAGKPKSVDEIVRGFVPKELKGGGFLLEPWQWIGVLVLFLIAFFAERLITLFLRPLVRRLSQFEGVKLPAEELARFERPLGWLILSGLFLGGVQALDLPTDVYAPMRIAIAVFATVMAAWTAYRAVDVLCWPLEVRAQRTEGKFDDMLVPLLRRTLKVVVALVGLLFVISETTGAIWHVLAGLSIGSLAVGFAAKDSIENLFGTFTVFLDSPFKIGDVIRVGDIEGTVEQVGFRSTRVRTPEDSLITVPNSRFIGTHVHNLGARRQRRILLRLGLTYDTPAEKLEAFCEAIRELVRTHPWTKRESYHVWFAGYGESSLDVEVVCFVETGDHATFLRERHRFLLDLLRLAERMQVSFAFPTRTVWSATPESAAHPDRPRTSEEAIQLGRASAREVTAASLAHLGGARPPLVRFDPANPDAIGR